MCGLQFFQVWELASWYCFKKWTEHRRNSCPSLSVHRCTVFYNSVFHSHPSFTQLIPSTNLYICVLFYLSCMDTVCFYFARPAYVLHSDSTRDQTCMSALFFFLSGLFIFYVGIFKLPGTKNFIAKKCSQHAKTKKQIFFKYLKVSSQATCNRLQYFPDFMVEFSAN